MTQVLTPEMMQEAMITEIPAARPDLDGQPLIPSSTIQQQPQIDPGVIDENQPVVLSSNGYLKLSKVEPMLF